MIVHTTTPTPNNLLVSEDFERAVQECRAKVRKLIKECRRVNMRYRDATFDLDWDLKWERGYCLNGLENTKFEISGRALANLSSNVPKSVKRVPEIFDKPTFLQKISPADIKQGGLGDCWLMASLTALANMQVGLQRICVEYDDSQSLHFTYRFFADRRNRNRNLWICFSPRSVQNISDDLVPSESPEGCIQPIIQRILLAQQAAYAVQKWRSSVYLDFDSIDFLLSSPKFCFIASRSVTIVSTDNAVHGVVRSIPDFYNISRR